MFSIILTGVSTLCTCYTFAIYRVHSITYSSVELKFKWRIVKWQFYERSHCASGAWQEYTALPLLPSFYSFSEGIRRRKETVNYTGRAPRRLYRHVGLNLYDQPLSRGRISSAIGPLFPRFCSWNVYRRRNFSSSTFRYGKAAHVIRAPRRAEKSERKTEIVPHRIRGARESGGCDVRRNPGAQSWCWVPLPRKPVNSCVRVSILRRETKTIYDVGEIGKRQK